MKFSALSLHCAVNTAHTLARSYETLNCECCCAAPSVYCVVFRIVPFKNGVKPTSSCTAALLCVLSFSTSPYQLL